MAVAMGEKTAGMTFEELAVRAIARIKELFIITAYPTKIPSDFVTEKDIPDLVKQAMTRPMTKFNRRKSSEKELAAIYVKALKGWE